jgi:hypothetical protein
MRSNLLGAAVAALALALPAAAHAQTTPAALPVADSAAAPVSPDWQKIVTDELRQARERWNLVFAGGTGPRIASMFAPGGVAISDRASMQPDEFGADMEYLGRRSGASFTPRAVQVISAEEARETGQYQFYLGGQLSRGDYTLQWVIGRDRRWQIKELRMLGNTIGEH